MKKVDAKLLFCSPLSLSVWAIRKCYDSIDKSDTFENGIYKDTNDIGEKDKELMFGKIMDSGHYSTLEHINFTFDCTFSRAVLQEWSRHRIRSQSTKSTRYTLSKLRTLMKKVTQKDYLDYKEWGTSPLDSPIYELKSYIEENLMFIDSPVLLNKQVNYLISCFDLADYTNDKFKYCLPESWATSSIDTFNVRSLRNLFELRTSKRAHFEIQELSKKMLDTIPESHKPFFKEFY